MNAIVLYTTAIEDVLAREMRFETGGNPRITKGWYSTGWMPNLPPYLREKHIHPLDYYEVICLLERRTEGEKTVSVYEINNSGSNILVEELTPGKALYRQYQIDADAMTEMKRIRGGEDNER